MRPASSADHSCLESGVLPTCWRIGADLTDTTAHRASSFARGTTTKSSLARMLSVHAARAVGTSENGGRGMMIAFVAALAAGIAGLALGWFGHRRAWTWCTACGGPVGTQCASCVGRDAVRTISGSRKLA